MIPNKYLTGITGKKKKIMMSSFMKTRGLSHSTLAIYTKKDLKAKEELCETQIFHHAKI